MSVCVDVRARERVCGRAGERERKEYSESSRFPGLEGLPDINNNRIIHIDGYLERTITSSNHICTRSLSLSLCASDGRSLFVSLLLRGSGAPVGNR